MQSRFWKQLNIGASLPLYIKCSAILLLFLLSVLVVACGSGTSNTLSTNPGNPSVTVTINLGSGNASPTPALAPYWCGAWATNTTPAYTSGTVDVYAKFTQNVNMNPVGVGGASATAVVTWPDNTTSTQTVTTTDDGLAIFAISVNGKADAVNKFTYVAVTFHKNGIPDCTVAQDRVAFFTLVVVSPTSTSTAVASPSATSTGSPTPGPSPTCTPRPGRPGKTPTPKPGGC